MRLSSPESKVRQARLMSRRTTAAVAHFRPALVPLFSVVDGRPFLIGTGVAIAGGEAHMILSAAHVLKRFATDTIMVPQRGRWQPLTGIIHFATTHGITDPDDDTVDAALLVLDSESVTHWDHWLRPDDLIPGCPTTREDRFVLVGFPRNAVRRSIDRWAAVPRALRFFGAPIRTAAYEGVLAKPDLHIGIGYRQPRTVQDDDGEPQSLYGTSGGMLIWAPGMRAPGRTRDNRLAGIFIEQHGAPHHLLLSTRIDAHLALIHDQLPALRKSFPMPRSFRMGRSRFSMLAAQSR